MYARHVVSGQVLWITDKYIVTTEGIFNRRWYRLPKEEKA